jgi:hypothetical protein
MLAFEHTYTLPRLHSDVENSSRFNMVLPFHLVVRPVQAVLESGPRCRAKLSGCHHIIKVVEVGLTLLYCMYCACSLHKTLFICTFCVFYLLALGFSL